MSYLTDYKEENMPVAKKTVKKASTSTTTKKVAKKAKKENLEDMFIFLDNYKHQVRSQFSNIYACKEYYWKGKFAKGQKVKFVHNDGSEVPVHHSSNCGYTLVGKAQKMFSVSKSLCANGEPSDDQQYVYINEHSVLSYVGKDGTHTIFFRVYDNINNNNNDRWVVLYID